MAAHSSKTLRSKGLSPKRSARMNSAGGGVIVWAAATMAASALTESSGLRPTPTRERQSGRRAAWSATPRRSRARTQATAAAMNRPLASSQSS